MLTQTDVNKMFFLFKISKQLGKLSVLDSFWNYQQNLVNIQKLLRFHTQPYLYIIVCYHILSYFVLSYHIVSLLFCMVLCYVVCFIFAQACFILFEHTVLHHV